MPFVHLILIHIYFNTVLTIHLCTSVILEEKKVVSPYGASPILPVPRLYRNLGRDPWLKGSIWFLVF